jgi:hypothetical protein
MLVDIAAVSCTAVQLANFAGIIPNYRHVFSYDEYHEARFKSFKNLFTSLEGYKIFTRDNAYSRSS